MLLFAGLLVGAVVLRLPTAAVNARCLEGVDLATLPRFAFDGRSL